MASKKRKSTKIHKSSSIILKTLSNDSVVVASSSIDKRKHSSRSRKISERRKSSWGRPRGSSVSPVRHRTRRAGKRAPGFPHLREKDTKYFYQEQIKKYDPFYHVDVATDCETYFVGQKARVEYSRMEHFAYVVDLDNYEYQKVVIHSFLNEILQSPFFRHGILFLVMVNAVLIGLATLPQLREHDRLFDLLDMIIVSVFIFEVMIKWLYDFRLFWSVNWNRLDFAILFLTIMAAVVPAAEYGDTASIIVRVVRAFRSLRCTSHMTSLTIVTHTVAKSGRDMINILIVLIIFMLVLSVMAVILFDIEDLTPQRFLNALDAWMVLFICVTQDGWALVLNGYDRSSTYFVLLASYLIFAVSVGAFVFANLIIAVIVANLEFSVTGIRLELKLHGNPLEFRGSYHPEKVDIIPVYDVLAKDDYVRISQRPLRIPRVRKVPTRRIQVYVSLVVALEQNMLEAEILSLDLEKIMAVILSISLQLEANIKNLSKEDKEAGRRTLDEPPEVDPNRPTSKKRKSHKNAPKSKETSKSKKKKTKLGKERKKEPSPEQGRGTSRVTFSKTQQHHYA